jgi:multiple sugar transport system permease protein
MDLAASLASYLEIGIAEPGFARELTTSLGVSITATALTIAISFAAAFSLARSRFRGIRLTMQGLLVLASLPVMAYVIPLNDLFLLLRLHDTLAGVALASTAVNTPLAMYVLYGYLKRGPVETEESARLDGASITQILWRVTLPIAAPGVAATAIVVFVLNWNLFLIPLVLTAGHVRTIPVAMSDFFTFERELEWPTAAALITSLLPLVVLVIAAHRAIERFSLGVEQEIL